MNTLLPVEIKGHIKITNQLGETLFDDNNAVGENAYEIICRCLSQLDFNKSVDIIESEGDYGQSQATIEHVEYNQMNNSMLFRATILENDFEGTINSLFLTSSPLNGLMAKKEGLSIYKDNSSRLQIDWVITINPC